jgi:PAS domain S-box-containing protein
MKFSEPTKILAMAVMLIAAVLLTFYFHKVMDTSVLFTHLFYIPIFFGAFWWGRRGMIIALVLGLILIASEWLYRGDPLGNNDYLRALIFLAVAWVVVVLRDRIIATESALEEKSDELQKRVQALSCLHGVSRLREKAALPMDLLFEETVNLLAQTGFEGRDAQARITYQGHIFSSGEPGQESFRMGAPILVNEDFAGKLEVFFTQAPVPGSFDSENTRELIETTAGRLGKIIEHDNARAELNRYHLHLEELVRERTEELTRINRRLHEEIAEREKINASLSESENKYRLLFENADEAIFIAQEDRVVFANPALSKLSGFSTGQIMESSFQDLVTPADRQLVSECNRQRIAGIAVPSSYAFRIRTADDSFRWVEINSVLYQWNGRPATLNYLRDITARHKIEASMGYLQKMEAIGVMAGGIAHKFNNALTGVNGNIELLKYTFPNNPAVERHSKAVLSSVQEMAGLVQQLLAYARGGKYQPRVQSLEPLVKEVALLIPTDTDKRVHIETALSPETPQVEVDAVQLRMVLLAVLNNAVEATGKECHIRIATFPAILDEAAAEAFTGLVPGKYAALSISDTGKGMSEEVRTRVFEPFFSTKFIGRGLGMAAAYGIIKNHNGYIYVDSEPNRGTTVHILLPTGKQNTESQLEATKPAPALPSA